MSKKLSGQELVPFGQNLLQNSTFAMGSSNWILYNGMSLTSARNGAGFYGILSGSASTTLNQKFSIRYATEITISLEAAQGSFQIGIELFNAAGDYVGVGTSEIINPGALFAEKRYTHTFAITPDVHFINFYIQKKDAVDILVRNIKVENRGVATPYTLEGEIYQLAERTNGNLTLINGWTGGIGWTKTGNVVRLGVGSVANTTYQMKIAQLPSNLIPRVNQVTYPLVVQGGTRVCNIGIGVDGGVYIANATTYVANDILHGGVTYEV